MLAREDLATELAVATRLVAEAAALAPQGRLSVLAGEVVYVAARGTSNATMTPYDIAIVLLADGYELHGEPPEDIAAHLKAHRRGSEAVGVADCADGTLVSEPSLRGCAIAALRRAGASLPEAASEDELWELLVARARASGALVGAYP